MEEIIRVENLTHTYGEGTPFCRSAVQDMSLAIYRGEFLGIIGHTGSGKSTLIQHLNGLLKPTSGRILLGGEDIWSDPKKIRNVRFRVGLVFQYPEYQLFEETVYRDIAFGPTNMGLSKDEIDRRVLESAHFAGLTDDLLEKSPFALSGGQKRRVAIAGVIAMEPEVLVLDEPSAGLDPQGREELLSNIREFHRARGTTVVLVSHSMEEIAKNVDRIVVLSDSHVLMSGTPREVFARGDELMTAGLDVPQVTRVAMALRDKGIAINPAVYTVDELSKELVALKRGGGKKMLKDITLGQFFPGDTLAHKLDPRTKLLVTVFYVVALFTAKSYIAYGVLILTLIVAVRISRVGAKALFKGLKPVLFIIAFTALLNLFYTPGTELCHFWIFRITIEGVRAAITMMLRITLLIMGTFLLTYTTSPIRLTDGLESLLGPLKKIKVPVHELAMMMSIALRFIPTLIEETDKIMSAQKARGADFETGSLMQRAKALVPLLVPLFVSAFRRADELATAMECRCYHGDEGRTKLNVLHYQTRDYLVLGYYAVLVAAVIALR